MKDTIRIYVACHKPAFVPENRLLVPVLVGASLQEDGSGEGFSKMKGLRRDDEGENISGKNRIFCELTAQYWAWKNEEADWYGFYHYRRYLSYRKVYPAGPGGEIGAPVHGCPFLEIDSIREDLEKYGCTEERMREVISRYDILTVLRERINTSVYRQYGQFHSKETLNRVLRILFDKYPEYREDAKRYLSSRDIYYMNMYVMKRDMFHKYMHWLFDILDTFEKECREKEDPSAEESRIMGFVAERLFGIFYTHQLREGARCAEVPYLRFYSTAPDGAEAEQDSAVRSFTLGPVPVKVKIDMRKLHRLFPAGSRRRNILRSLMYR